MEDHNAVNFMRLLSEESTHSTMSLDSCEYYQTEIFDQLPSIQASRPERNTDDLWGPCRVNQGGPEPGLSHLSKGAKDKTSTRPLRDLAMCIQAKRGARERRKMQVSNIGFWESWRQGQSTNRRRAWAQMGGALSSLLPWQHTLHAIEGRFGVGVKSYFVFLRYLVWLNLLHCLAVGGFIVGPTLYGSIDKIKNLRFASNDSILDFFLGTGYLDRSPVFYGFYTRGFPNLPCLNTPLLYLGGILTIFFLSLIMVVHRTIVGYKHTWMLEKRYNMNVSFKIFCGWDFTIQDPSAASLKCSVIRNDLKLILEEQSFSLREAQRTLGQRARLYLLRFVINLFVVALLGGAFYLIYFTMTTRLYMEQQHWLVNLILEYLPPITITVINLVLPFIFCKISRFEDYSLTTQVNVTLVRCIFLELASLGIYLYNFFTTTENLQCLENTFGREMYKLCFIKFLTIFCNTFLWDYPRKLLQEKDPSSLLARMLGKQRFLIPFNVLDLVSFQTVFWVGVYYCPLLPLIGTVTLIATFYIKKFTVLRCCVAEQRMFRGSSSSVLFHFMLLLGLIMAAVTLGFNFFQQHGQVDQKMSSCGPFGNGETVFNVTAACVVSLPPKAQTIVRYLASEAFALPLILTEVIILTWFVSRGRANQKAIERLKDMLVMSCSDKRFLVKQHTTMLRRQKNDHRVHAAASK